MVLTEELAVKRLPSWLVKIKVNPACWIHWIAHVMILCANLLFLFFLWFFFFFFYFLRLYFSFCTFKPLKVSSLLLSIQSVAAQWSRCLLSWSSSHVLVIAMVSSAIFWSCFNSQMSMGTSELPYCLQIVEGPAGSWAVFQGNPNCEWPFDSYTFTPHCEFGKIKANKTYLKRPITGLPLTAPNDSGLILSLPSSLAPSKSPPPKLALNGFFRLH